MISFSIPTSTLAELSRERIDEIETQLQESDAEYLVVLEGGPDGNQNWQEYAQVIGNQLDLKGTRGFHLRHYTLNDWVKRNEVTAKSLNEIEAELDRELVINVQIYRVLNDSQNE